MNNLANAQHHAAVLAGLLSECVGNFDFTAEAVRKDGADCWVRDYYTSTSRGVLGAQLIAENLTEILLALDDQ